MRPLSQEEVITRFVARHGDRYDYSEVKFIDCKTPVKVKCREHGYFFTLVHSHTNGSVGCPYCGHSIKSSIEEFIKKANKVHEGFYDYSETEYFAARAKLDIICPIHGKFNQSAESHLGGVGCMQCGIIASRQAKFLSKDELIEKFKKVHENTYDYSCVELIAGEPCNKKKVTIVCLKHGSFLQVPHSHLKGRGCPKCANVISKPEIKWLNTLKIPEEFRQYRLKIDNKKIKVDGIDLENKIVYEFLGDYWHGNPAVFDKNKLHPLLKKTYSQLHKETFARIRKIRKLGYKVVYIWENNWNKRK